MGSNRRKLEDQRRDAAEKEADGPVRLLAVDSGELVEKVWGDDDYEFWLDVAARICLIFW
jgi:hypothetical protein